MTPIATTDRLVLRHSTPADAAFYCRLVNKTAWAANIGDRQVRSLADAEQQIRQKLMAAYAQHGFGLYLVSQKNRGDPLCMRGLGTCGLGMCGLVKRDTLTASDIEFAFLQEHWGQGYALQAAQAVLNQAFLELGLARVLGITKHSNQSSARLLIKLGLQL